MQSEFRADLHCHSTCSDGTDSPFALLQLAKQVDLQGLSITDHDTVDAYTSELFAEAKRLSIRLLPGVEISSAFEGTSVHILGYGCDFRSKNFKEFLLSIQKKREERNRAILQKLAREGMPISEEELNAFGVHRTIGRPHIAQLMVKKGYAATVRDAFDRYLHDGGRCYALGIKYTPEEVIEQIHKAKGKAILAHPHFLKKESLVHALLTFAFDGLECYYSQLAKAFELPWLEIAKKRNLIATGGSDYHGAINPSIPLGCSWVDAHTFELLAQRST